VVAAGDQQRWAADLGQLRSQVWALEGDGDDGVDQRGPVHAAQAIDDEPGRLRVLCAGCGGEQHVSYARDNGADRPKSRTTGSRIQIWRRSDSVYDWIGVPSVTRVPRRSGHLAANTTPTCPPQLPTQSTGLSVPRVASTSAAASAHSSTLPGALGPGWPRVLDL
jgi:hypothetical protein